MTPSLAALALPVAAGAVVVSTGGQMRAQVPVHLLAAGVSAVNAYRVAVTCRNPAVMARIFAPAAVSEPTVVVPGFGVPWGRVVYQTPKANGSMKYSPLVSPDGAPAPRSNA